MEQQQATETQTESKAIADDSLDSDLGALADKYSEPEPDTEGSEEPAQEEAATDEQPEAEEEGASASAPLGDDAVITLEDGSTVTVGELKELRKVFGANPKADEWFKNYQRKQSELDRQRKEWEAKAQPTTQKATLFDQLDQQFQADPVQYALNTVALAVRQGLLDPQVYQALAGTVEQIQQAGAYDPYKLAANAAQMRSRQSVEQYEQAQRFHQAQSQVYDLERSLGRFLDERERTELANLIEYTAVQEGRVIPLQEAWNRYQSLKPPPKPMAQPSPAKVMQQVKKQTKPTTERASGRNVAGKYNKADLDKDLDVILKNI